VLKCIPHIQVGAGIAASCCCWSMLSSTATTPKRLENAGIGSYETPSSLLKREPKVESRAQAVGFTDLALSVITVAEVLHGAYFSANPSHSLAMTAMGFSPPQAAGLQPER
jgi:hypothetical protein